MNNKKQFIQLKITRRGKPVKAATIIQQSGDIYTLLAYSMSGKPCDIEIVSREEGE